MLENTLLSFAHSLPQEEEYCRNFLSGTTTYCLIKDILSDLYGGVLYYDGQMNDARVCTSLALTANAHGAAASNYCEVVHLRKGIDEGLSYIGAWIARYIGSFICNAAKTREA